MTDVITFRHRGSDETESYDCTALPEAVWRPLALIGVKAILTTATDRSEMHRQLMSGEFTRTRRKRDSNWKQAALAVKAKKLKKEGHSDPDTGAMEWWENLSTTDRTKLKFVPEIMIAHAKVSGKGLPEI